ncbi:hypothetical protein BABINDRAFT_99697 [Babjeviella inositovora NRRL Y-12698]|uniref:Glucosamine-6-phosphate isomerase n=1 Tax=Babjeviella inositovora NRRL Y-12698 TaxID=984486 RepID=A0A1E3QIN9_9ASCO|nr:uncharacterized protein BABINDRAFT_99697 [Babjeviella inositovora NRRL Y-12698]ODQ77555.1 hypothetical protein BABINDRAFT_99697 [Babjeviella inositovora NRRL Y-12698]
MQQKVFANGEKASDFLAEYIVEKINAFNPTPSRPFVIGLPTGSSPEKVYLNLVGYYKAGKISFENVVSFNMDEYLGLPPTDHQSYHYFMHHHLFDHINMKPENINILDGLAADPAAECARYEAKIKSYGGIQLFLGGLGPEGHIAFNEAGSSRDSLTRKVTLAPSTLEANSRFFDNDPNKVPKFALSVGISTVLDNSEEVVIIVIGKPKQFALQKTTSGPVGSKFPCTFLQTHPNVLIVADSSAANKIKSFL